MNDARKNKNKAFMVTAGAIINNMVATVTFVVLGLILAELVVKLDVPYSRLSLVYTFSYVGMLISSLVSGKIVVKLGGKIAGLIVTAGVIAIIFVSCTATSLPLIYGVAIFYGFGNILAFMYMHIMTTQWFNRGAATLIGVGSGVATVGCTVASPILAQLFVSKGISAGGIMVTVILAVIMLVSSLFLCGNVPESYGMVSISFGKEKEKKTEKKKLEEEIYDAAMPKSKIVRTPMFLAIVATAILGGLALNMYSTNQYMILAEFGFNTVVAAGFVSAGTIVSTVGSLVCGALIDMIGRKKTFILFTAGCAVFFLAGYTLGGAIGASMLVAGTFFGTFDKFRPTILLNSLFGPHKSPDLISWDGTFVCLGSMFASPIAANIASAAGSYKSTGYISVILLLMCTLLVTYITSKSTLEKLKKMDKEYKEA